MSKNKAKLERGIIPALILFVICAIATALLAGTHEMTKDKIAERARAAMEANKRQLFPTATEFEEVTPPEGADVILIEAAQDDTGNILGYFFQTEAKGYGGLIQTYTGINADGTLAGVIFGENEETPGFGKKIEQDWFMANFKDKPANSFFVTKPSGDSAEADAESSATQETADAGTQEVVIDMISGATVSSNGACTAVNKATEAFRGLND